MTKRFQAFMRQSDRSIDHVVKTRLRFKRLSNEDLEMYLASGEWRGIAGSFVIKLAGPYTGVVGLPLYETVNLLGGEGFPIRFGWMNMG
ncbi:hypothetical protein BHK69_15810 [Bosea vaviloviae]|uniref:Uncharacterized protein n=1 Tax=Bosea vaviloviae TaxID=1526658 RepID=A0A1D7U2X1_9HYPH|nr:hypothetical protein BHK69_15810 [Bosea vaviloviae]